MPSSNRFLKDTDTLKILIKDCFNIFRGQRQSYRVEIFVSHELEIINKTRTNLLEPDQEGCAKDRNVQDRILFAQPAEHTAT
jgi:hypothetical protein